MRHCVWNYDFIDMELWLCWLFVLENKDWQISKHNRSETSFVGRRCHIRCVLTIPPLQNKPLRVIKLIGPILVLFSLFSGFYVGTRFQVTNKTSTMVHCEWLKKWTGLAMVLLSSALDDYCVYRHGREFCAGEKGEPCTFQPAKSYLRTYRT